MKTIILSIIITLFACTIMVGQTTKVTGQNVTLIKFGKKANSFLGTFVQIGDSKKWEEEGKKQGVARFKFRETHRDDWSVYLVDDSRGVKIQLDLQTNKVLYGDRHNPEMRPLYVITEAYPITTEWTFSKLWGWNLEKKNLRAKW